MSDHTQLLHDLLKEDQEPFKLKSYISQKRSQLKKPPPITTLQVKKQSNFCKLPCFFSFRNSPDVRKSPFVTFPSQAMSPCKSPAGGAVFLHVPSRTATVLVEAAMRIQSKPKSQSVREGLFGSFLKRLKDRSTNRKRDEFRDLRNYEPKEKEIKMSCSCDNSRLSRSDLEASTLSCGPEELDQINRDFALCETRFCSSPFSFSVRGSPSSSSGRRTPEFSSPAASPNRHVKQEGESNSVQGEEEKEQCSPVSVLDPFFEDEAHESEDADDEEEEEENNYDPDSTYANVQRAKQQLLNRLRRFEQLAQLDPMELEKQLLEGNSDDEYQTVSVESEDDDPLSLYRKQCADKFINQVEGKNLGKREVVWGTIFCNRLISSWKEVEFGTVGTVVELDFRKEFGEWKEFPEQVEEAAGEVALAIYGVLVEELTKEMFGMFNS